MTIENQRLIDVCELLVKGKYARSLAEIARELGKTSQYFTDIKNGKSNYPRKLLDILCEKYPSSKKYIVFVDGEAIKLMDPHTNVADDKISEPDTPYQKPSVEVELSDVIKSQRSIISSQQSTINKLTDIIYEMTQKK